LLTKEFFEREEATLVPYVKTLAVKSRIAGHGYLRGLLAFWQPDLEKLFSGCRVASSASSEQAPEVPEKRGRPPVYDRGKLIAVAVGLSVQRKQGEPIKNQATVIKEVRNWCRQQNIKAPSPSMLAEIVSEALRIRATLSRQPVR
jgi:hypothetical protein